MLLKYLSIATLIFITGAFSDDLFYAKGYNECGEIFPSNPPSNRKKDKSSEEKCKQMEANRKKAADKRAEKSRLEKERRAEIRRQANEKRVSEEEAATKNNEANLDDENSSAKSEQLSHDMSLLKEIEGDIGRWKTSYEDTEVMQKKKERMKKESIVQMNKKWKGKKLSFENLCLNDVEPEKELNPNGKRKADQLLAAMKQEAGKDYELVKPWYEMSMSMLLGFCEDCWRDTGKYNVKFQTPDSNGVCGTDFYSDGPEVFKLVVNEDQALEYKKNQAYQVSGIVDLITYDSSLKINLK